jgi:hypothetical protein
MNAKHMRTRLVKSLPRDGDQPAYLRRTIAPNQKRRGRCRMTSRNLIKRLEQLEGRILPPREIHLIRVVYGNGPDRLPVGGYTVGPGYGPQATGEPSERPAPSGEWGICLRP